MYISCTIFGGVMTHLREDHLLHCMARRITSCDDNKCKHTSPAAAAAAVRKRKRGGGNGGDDKGHHKKKKGGQWLAQHMYIHYI